nr:MAG TPA: hypothetical protein [Microviridae sp.]
MVLILNSLLCSLCSRALRHPSSSLRVWGRKLPKPQVKGCSLTRQRTKPTPSLIFY